MQDKLDAGQYPCATCGENEIIETVLLYYCQLNFLGGLGTTYRK